MKWLAAVVLLLGACASTPAPLQDGTHFTPRPDGTSIEWRLNGRTGAAKQGVLLLSQGSGCAPAATSPNLPRWKDLAPGFAWVTVEKYGVSADDPSLTGAGVGQMENCPPAFAKGYRLYGRVADFEAVVAELRRQSWWSGELVLMGGSEGGGVMSALAPRLPEADAVVLLSSATGWPLARIITESLPPPARPEIAAMFDGIRANPDAPGEFGGVSAQFFAEIMDKPLAEDLLMSPAPVLLVFGELDQSGPVQSARDTESDVRQGRRADDLSGEAGLGQLRLTDRAGVNHIDEVIAEATAWVREQLAR